MPPRGGLNPSRVVSNGLRPRQIRVAKPRVSFVAQGISDEELTLANQSYATADKPLPPTSSPAPKEVESKSSASTPGGLPPPLPKKKRHLFRKTVAYSTLLTVAAYGVGTVAAVNNERAHDFFVESVPLGEAIVDYLEAQGYVGGLPRGSTAPLAAPFTVPKSDAPTIKPAQIPAPVPITTPSKQGTPPKPKAEPKPKSEAQIKKEEAKAAAQARIEAAKAKAKESAKATGDHLKQVAATVHTTVEKQPAGAVYHPPVPANIERHQTPGRPVRLPGGIEELVNEVEVALDVMGTERAKPGNVESSVPTLEEPKPPPGRQWYEGPPLPLGWEPPPGYVTRPPKKVPRANSGLLLVAPSVSSFAPLEPVLADLASTIDNLAQYLEDHPKALKGADKVLQHAQSDLIQLGAQIKKSREEAKLELETKLDQQAREYSMQLLDTDIKHQDQLDTQDEDWRKYFDQERLALLQRYQEKLDQELAAQEDIINQRYVKVCVPSVSSHLLIASRSK
jgi:mitofilin